MRHRAILALAVLVLASVPVTQAAAIGPTLIAQYTATGVWGDQAPPNYGLRLDGFFDNNGGHEVTFSFDNVLFNVFDDGTAYLQGLISVAEYNNSGSPNPYASTWNMNVKFAEITNPTALSAISGYSASMDYYDLIHQGQELVNTANASDYADLWTEDEGGTKPFRVGLGGNGKNVNFGASGWLRYQHFIPGANPTGNPQGYIGSSDFLMDLTPTAVPEPGTMTLLTLGLLGGVGRLSRRRRRS